MQYDVYLNPNAKSRHLYPYMMDVQADLLNALPTRLVVPLRAYTIKSDFPRNLTPSFFVKDEEFTLMTYLATAMDKKNLKKKVFSLKQHASEIIPAIDCVLCGI